MRTKLGTSVDGSSVRPTQERRRRFERAALLLVSVTLSFGVAELGIRMLGGYDVDGTFWFRWRKLRPFGPPDRGIRLALAQLARPESVFSYDPVVGWKPKPLSCSRDGLYVHNAQGLRVRTTGTVYAPRVASGVLRIALFGDSLTYGGAVGYDESWGAQLERRLASDRLRVEVQNFAVTGYGMDQAYLRWREEGVLFAPHVVVFGFAVADLGRNLNLVKGLYLSCLMKLGDGSFMPLAKPRFVLESGGLRLLNVPTVRPEELADLVAHFNSWELSRYERYYDPADYRKFPLSTSKMVALGVDVWRRNRFTDPRPSRALFQPGGESATLALAIVSQFRREVEGNGSVFIVVHLPEMPAVRAALEGRPLAYPELFAALRSQPHFVDPLPAFLSWAYQQGTWAGLFASKTDFHYSGVGNGLLADAMRGEIAHALVAAAPPTGVGGLQRPAQPFR